jgi:hypothetical protein
MSDTPRTDVETYELDYKVLIPREGGEWVKADFARELEREVARVTAERDLARRLYCHAQAATIRDARHEAMAARLGWDCFDAKEVQP